LATAVPVIHQPILGVTGPGILPGRRRYTAGDPLLHLTRPLAIQRRQTDNRLFIPRLSLTDRAEFPPAQQPLPVIGCQQQAAHPVQLLFQLVLAVDQSAIQLRETVIGADLPVHLRQRTFAGKTGAGLHYRLAQLWRGIHRWLGWHRRSAPGQHPGEDQCIRNNSSYRHGYVLESIDKNGCAVDHVGFRTLIGRRREGTGTAYCLLGSSVQQFIPATIDLITHYAPIAVHGNFIGDIALALEVIGIALVPRWRLVHRAFRTFQIRGYPVLHRIGIGGGDRAAAHRLEALRRHRRSCPFLIRTEAVDRRAGWRRRGRLRSWRRSGRRGSGFRLRLRRGLRCGFRLGLWDWLGLRYRLGLGFWLWFRQRSYQLHCDRLHLGRDRLTETAAHYPDQQRPMDCQRQTKHQQTHTPAARPGLIDGTHQGSSSSAATRLIRA